MSTAGETVRSSRGAQRAAPDDCREADGGASRPSSCYVEAEA
jgi:hypothetical protein